MGVQAKECSASESALVQCEQEYSCGQENLLLAKIASL
jgi:hypothetical protein